jgi:hypothetical protein
VSIAIATTLSTRASGALRLPPTATAADFFKVMRAPQTETPMLDRVNSIAGEQMSSPEYGEIDPTKTRFLGEVHGQGLFVLAGDHLVCLASVDMAPGSRGLTVGCSPLSAVATDQPLTLSGEQSDGSVRVDALVPDSASTVEVQDDPSAAPRVIGVANNLATAFTPKGHPRLVVKDRSGSKASVEPLAAEPTTGP